MGTPRRGGSRGRRAHCSRSQGARGDRGDSVRRIRLRRGIGDQSAQVLPQQRRQHLESAGCDGRCRSARHRVFVDLRHLRRTHPRPHRRGSSAESRESLRRIQADGRKNAPLVPGRLRLALRRAPLLQCRRRGSRWRSRRRSRSRDASHPADDRRGHGTTTGAGHLRHRLSVARRNGHSRLHPRRRFGRRAPAGPRSLAARGRQVAAQSGHRYRSDRAAGGGGG